jgi:sensor domain CHASE-containing protein
MNIMTEIVVSGLTVFAASFALTFAALAAWTRLAARRQPTLQRVSRPVAQPRDERSRHGRL